jgi:methylenetetrahydrofolate reductase (NADPH)
MKISDILSTGKQTISFEFFPPKTDEGLESLFKTIDRLKVYRPDYVSVTYGAGGSTRDRTEDIVIRIKDETGLRVMSHLTCVAQTKEDVHNVLVRLEEVGIENVLGLRGDPPRGEGKFVPAEGGFLYASELIAHIRENFDFGIAGACFPEGHLDSVDLEADIAYLKKKIEAGADFLITQLFFDNRDFFDFMDRAGRAGIHLPVIAGILPILSTPQIRRFTALCGAKIPPELDQQLERFAEDDDAVREIGVEHATAQVEELWRSGVAGVHLYTLNRSYSVSRLLDSLDPSRAQTIVPSSP